MSSFSEYGQYDALGLAELVRSREITPLELVEEAIRRVEAVNPQLNAVIYKMYDHARERALGPLPAGPFTGVPFLLKDLLASYEGQPITGGSRAMQGYIATHDSELVRRFKAAGVITIGKSNTSELGLEPVTEPALFGPTSNPWDPARTPSGSSGGSAAAVAARIVPFASGGDGGGSIRTPASACGIFGLKPSRGRNPGGPDRSEVWQGAVSEHVLTRSVRDSAAMLDATSGPDVGAPYYVPPPERPFLEQVTTEPGVLRIAYSTASLLGDHVHEDCVRGADATVALLRELGHELCEASPEIDKKQFTHAYVSMICGETAADVVDMSELRGRRIAPRELELGTRTIALLGRSMSAAAFNRACRHLQRVTRQIGRFFQDYDLLLTPTLAQPPLLTGALQPTRGEAAVLHGLGAFRASNMMKALGVIGSSAAKVFGFSAYTPLFNVTGQPAMSVPLYWNGAGLPIGMHFAARYSDEATLFRLAGQLERASPWKDRRPPISAD